MAREIPTNDLIKIFDLPEKREDENQVTEQYAKEWGILYVMKSTRASIESFSKVTYTPDLIDSLLESLDAYNRRLKYLQELYVQKFKSRNNE